METWKVRCPQFFYYLEQKLSWLQYGGPVVLYGGSSEGFLGMDS